MQISTIPTDAHPTGYIVSKPEDLLGLFDADSGRILGRAGVSQLTLFA